MTNFDQEQPPYSGYLAYDDHGGGVVVGAITAADTDSADIAAFVVVDTFRAESERAVVAVDDAAVEALGIDSEQLQSVVHHAARYTHRVDVILSLLKVAYTSLEVLERCNLGSALMYPDDVRIAFGEGQDRAGATVRHTRNRPVQDVSCNAAFAAPQTLEPVESLMVRKVVA